MKFQISEVYMLEILFYAWGSYLGGLGLKSGRIGLKSGRIRIKIWEGYD